MSRNPLTTAVLAGSRGECQRIAAVLEEGGIGVARTALTAAGLEPLEESGLVVVLSGLRSAAQVKQVVLEVKRRGGETPVVVIAPDGELGAGVRAALEANAEGVLSAARLGVALAATVRAVDAGLIALPRSQRHRARPVVLSHRERQVLRLAVDGMTNDTIAHTLFISRSTVKTHLSAAFAKLSVRSRSEAALVLANPDDPVTRLLFGGAGAASDPAELALAEGG